MTEKFSLQPEKKTPSKVSSENRFQSNKPPEEKVKLQEEDQPQPLPPTELIESRRRQQPPTLSREDFLTFDKRHFDADKAKSLPDLIDMIRQVGIITNQNGVETPAEDIISLIYDRLLNPQTGDWTKITLRHNLRKRVYELAKDYQKTKEYQQLAGLNLHPNLNYKQLVQEIKKQTLLPTKAGNLVDANQIIKWIKNKEWDNLPIPLVFKLESLERRKLQTKLEKEVKNKQKTNFFKKIFKKFRRHK
ncbi:MAG: hypothetical protein ACOCU8_02660 [Patescibacteria group bacterium]